MVVTPQTVVLKIPVVLLVTVLHQHALEVIVLIAVETHVQEHTTVVAVPHLLQVAKQTRSEVLMVIQEHKPSPVVMHTVGLWIGITLQRPEKFNFFQMDH